MSSNLKSLTICTSKKGRSETEMCFPTNLTDTTFVFRTVPFAVLPNSLREILHLLDEYCTVLYLFIFTSAARSTSVKNLPAV